MSHFFLLLCFMSKRGFLSYIADKYHAPTARLNPAIVPTIMRRALVLSRPQKCCTAASTMQGKIPIIIEIKIQGAMPLALKPAADKMAHPMINAELIDKQRQHKGKQKLPICGARSDRLLHRGTLPYRVFHLANIFPQPLTAI